MRKVIGIGETILDIIFKDEQPLSAVPGGSVFNGIISLGRIGANVTFISEIGKDRVGNMIKEFMLENGVNTDHITIFPDGKSPVSLAFLNEKSSADYVFYQDYPTQRLDVTFPEIKEDDIVMFGSYFALNPALRNKVTELLEYARQQKAIIYYDLNFRKNHAHEAIKLTSAVLENLEYATIVRGSDEDFANLYKGLTDVDKIYKSKIKFYCPNLLYTAGVGNIHLCTSSIAKEYPVTPIQAVSTIGAGDNFNAGIIYGILKNNIRFNDIDEMKEEEWNHIIESGKDFSAEVCRSYYNSISNEFAAQYGKLS